MIRRARRRVSPLEPTELGRPLEVGDEALRESVRVAIHIAALRVDPCPWVWIKDRR